MYLVDNDALKINEIMDLRELNMVSVIYQGCLK